MNQDKRKQKSAKWDILSHVLISLCLLLTVAKGQDWEKLTPPCGGRVDAISFGNDGSIYAAVGTDLFKSQGPGKKWERRASFFGSVIRHTAISTGDMLFLAVDDQGIQRSTDGGATFSAMTSVDDPLNRSTFLACSGEGRVLAGTSTRIFLSTDGGSSWSDIGLTWWTTIQAAAINLNGVILVSTPTGTYRSSDLGVTWTIHSYKTANSLYFAPSSDLYAKIAGIGYSRFIEDTGVWQPLFKTEYNQRNLVADSTGRLYVMRNDSLFKSNNKGLSWQPILSPEGSLQNLQCGAAGMLYAGTFAGVKYSSDYGATWHPMNAGLNNMHVTSLAIDNRNNYYAGTTESIVFSSNDGGSSWGSILDVPSWLGSWVNSLHETKNNSLLIGISYLGIDGGGGIVYRYTGPGSVRTKGGEPPIVDQFYEGRNGLLYSISHFSGDGLPSSKLLQASTDDGATWTGVHLWPDSLEVIDFAISNSGTLYAAERTRNRYPYKYQFSYSLNNGEKWFRLNGTSSSLPSISRILSADEDVVTTIAYTGTVYRVDDWSTDSIGTISPISLHGYCTASIEFPNGMLAVGTSKGHVLRSTNKGADWKLLEGDLPARSVLDLQLDSTGRLLALFDSSLLYRTSFNVLNVRENRQFTPQNVTLHQNYPNPFNPTTKIEYAVTHPGHVRLILFNMLGQPVKTLVDAQEDTPGNKTLILDATNLASGVYVYRLESMGYTQSKKLLLIR